MIYRCKISNGKLGCRDYPKCVGGDGCVNTGPKPCSSPEHRYETNNVQKPLGELRSGLGGSAGIIAAFGGQVFMDRCEITECGGGGVLCDGKGSYFEVKNCNIQKLIQMGIEVRNEGYMRAENNEITKCNTHGVAVGPFGNCFVRNNEIFGNGNEGIFCCSNSNARIIGNIIHHNGLCGISFDGGSYELISNQIYENWCWGVMFKLRSSCSFINNDIFENKCGGIRIGWNYSAPVFLDGNTIRDHCGPAIYIDHVPIDTPLTQEDLQKLGVPKDHVPIDTTLTQVDLEKLGVPKDEHEIYTTSPIVTDRNIIRDNDKVFLHPSRMAESILVCFYCRKTAKTLKNCAKCKKALYCSKECQTRDWIKHKHICEILLGSYTIKIDMKDVKQMSSIKTDGNHTEYSRIFNPELKGIMEGPKPDRKSSKEFIVKIQSGYEYRKFDSKMNLSLYDRSTDLDIQFMNVSLYHLIMECGQLGTNQLTSKKIFCWAYFEKKGSVLRIRTDTLAPYQTW